MGLEGSPIRELKPIRGRIRIGEVVLEPRSLSEKYISFISHAHNDHMPKRGKGKAIAHEITLRYVEGAERADLPPGFRILPAGHVPGAGMLYYEGSLRILYTGDFSLHSSPLYEGASPVKVDLLLVDATYGHRGIRFPDRDEEIRRMMEFLEEVERATILTYTFGKPQEIIAYMRRYFGSGIEEEIGMSQKIYVKTLKMQDLLSELEINVNSLSKDQNRRYYITSEFVRRGDPIVVPSGMLRRLGFQFWISDHADYYQTLDFIQSCSPSLVVVTNGPTKDLNEELEVPVISYREFTRMLREIE